MERADKAYAEAVHITGLHPYSQYISSKDGLTWTIRTLNPDAYKGIIEPLLAPDFNGFNLTAKDIHVDIISKSIKLKTYEDLMKTFNSDAVEKYIKIEFESPTAFKRDSTYVFMPDTRLIFGSLMRKYSAASSSVDMTDEETLQYISDHSFISDFRIRSTRFPLEGTKIPSFMGEVTLHFRGTDTMARYARMLLEFGEYSGIGIKCGIGMGAIKIIREDK
jgi:CRISPR-associated endoribonuclease Cas6